MMMRLPIRPRTRYVTAAATLLVGLLVADRADAQIPGQIPPFNAFDAWGVYSPGTYAMTTMGYGYPHYYSPFGFGYGGRGWSTPYVGGYGVGGYGYPGYGTGYGYPGYGYGNKYAAYGNPYNTYFNYMGNLSKLRMLNAEAMRRYQDAEVTHQEALKGALQNYKTMNKLDPYYNYQTTAERFKRADAAPLPLKELVDQSGRVLWPEEAPDGPGIERARKAVEDAVAKVVREGKNPKVSDVVEARDLLDSYTLLALPQLSEKDAEKAAGFQYFLMSLDNALANMGTGGAMSMNIEPKDAPKSAGDVLKNKLDQEQPNRSNNNNGTIQPKDAPKSAGEAVRESTTP